MIRAECRNIGRAEQRITSSRCRLGPHGWISRRSKSGVQETDESSSINFTTAQLRADDRQRGDGRSQLLQAGIKHVP